MSRRGHNAEHLRQVDWINFFLLLEKCLFKFLVGYCLNKTVCKCVEHCKSLHVIANFLVNLSFVNPLLFLLLQFCEYAPAFRRIEAVAMKELESPI